MLTVVVGGFFGDEGKGKVVGYLAKKDEVAYCVRAGGGPQAGHTVTNGMKVTQIPSGFVSLNSRLLIARGTIINPQTVLKEIKEYEQFKVGERLGIDYGCTVIEPGHIELEKELVARIGSVGTGAGPARVDRVLRKGKLAKDVPELKPYLVDAAEEVNLGIADRASVLIEGVQGYGLSLLDHENYPYVTSQDTTASQFLADAGVGPRAVRDVVVVYKAYVSRVGKGPLPLREWTEEEKDAKQIREKGSVSGRDRRFCDFDYDLACKSMVRNTGSIAAMTCIDRLFRGNTGVTDYDSLTTAAQEFLAEVHLTLLERCSNRGYYSLGLLSTGPNLEDMIDVRPNLGFP